MFLLMKALFIKGNFQQHVSNAYASNVGVKLFQSFHDIYKLKNDSVMK